MIHQLTTPPLHAKSGLKQLFVCCFKETVVYTCWTFYGKASFSTSVCTHLVLEERIFFWVNSILSKFELDGFSRLSKFERLSSEDIETWVDFLVNSFTLQ